MEREGAVKLVQAVALWVAILSTVVVGYNYYDEHAFDKIFGKGSAPGNYR